MVGSKDHADLGQPGSKTEAELLSNGATYYGKGKGSVMVTMPLRDRNGEVVAAVG